MEILEILRKEAGKALGKISHFVVALGGVFLLGSFTRYNDKDFHFPENEPNIWLFSVGVVIVIVGIILYFTTKEEAQNVAEVSTYKGDWIYHIEIKHEGRERVVYAHMELKPVSAYGNFKASGHVWLAGRLPTEKTTATWEGYASFLGAERLLITFSVNTRNGLSVGYDNPTSYSGIIDILLSKEVKLLEGHVHDFLPLPGTGQFYAKRPTSKRVEDIRNEAYESFGKLQQV